MAKNVFVTQVIFNLKTDKYCNKQKRKKKYLASK